MGPPFNHSRRLLFNNPLWMNMGVVPQTVVHWHPLNPFLFDGSPTKKQVNLDKCSGGKNPSQLLGHLPSLPQEAIRFRLERDTPFFPRRETRHNRERLAQPKCTVQFDCGGEGFVGLFRKDSLGWCGGALSQPCVRVGCFKLPFGVSFSSGAENNWAPCLHWPVARHAQQASGQKDQRSPS